MSIPARELPHVAWRRILREVRTRTAPRKPRTIKIGATVREIAAELRKRQMPRFFGLFPEQAALIGQFFPDAMWITIAEAEKICAHTFNILGSGEKELGAEIDWHTDFKHGYTWPLTHHTRLTLASPTGGFDVKVPWELSRFHHAIRLGQAYLYTLDEKYAEEIVAQIKHWISSNPYEFGVNWAGPMDVAIRVVNWIWAYYLIIESEALDEKFLALWLTSLRQHGEYLMKHLEDTWPRTNHLIANLTGLAFLGIMFPEFSDAAKWKKTGLGRLWQELEQQVNADGMDYEASISYHRLVTEMALGVAALCVMNDIHISEATQARIGSMLDVIMAYTRPDGSAPIVGDADDGRLAPLSVYEDQDRAVNDHRHLLALGSLVLERELSEWAGFIDPRERGWSVAAGDEWQDAFWYFSSDAAARYTDVLTQTTPRPEEKTADEWVEVRPGVRVRARALARRAVTLDQVTHSRGLEASGLYIQRDRDFHLVFDAGGVGMDGAGGHAHNDTLSLTLYALGRRFLVDPGSYVYTSDPNARNGFRATSAHNTLQIAHEEINPLPEDELFRLPEEAQITIHHWIAQEAFDLIDASHNAYQRLEPGVLHRRQVWFDKNAGLWVLHDALRPVIKSTDDEDVSTLADKKSEITVSLWFHFASLEVRVDQTNNAVRTDEDGANLAILPLGNFPLTANLEEGEISPRYGVKETAPVACFNGHVTLPVDLVLLLYPHEGRADFQAVRNAGRKALRTMRETLTPSLRGQ